MTRRTVRLLEHRAREVPLPPNEVAFLLTHARHLLEVGPSFRRGRYRLVARGHVGWFDTPTRRYAITPKIPWPNVRMLLGLSSHAGGDAVETDAGLLDVFGREFAARLRDAASTGLVAGYQDCDTVSTFLRGKLRAADQLRDAAARAFPDRFHVTESVLDLDTPWNRIPRSIADRLLSDPALPPATRNELRDAARPLEGVSVTAIGEEDFTRSAAESRAAHYDPLLKLCRTLHDGFTASRLVDGGGGGFLIDLSRAFERYLTRGLTSALAARPAWVVTPQPEFAVGPTVLQPDILVRRRAVSRVVLDAKWKSPGRIPNPADLHQILAYAAITGAKRVGLVYPGRRSACRAFAISGTDTRVSLVRLRVVGTAEECGRSLAALARLIRRPHGRE